MTMRLLYFSDNNSDHNRRFLAKLSFSMHEVFYLSLAGAPPLGFLPDGVRLVDSSATFPRHTPPSVLKSFVPELRKIAAKLKPDVIQAGAIQSCAYLSALAGIRPILAMSWGSDILVDADRDAEWQDATRIALAGAEGLFCDCDTVREKVLHISKKTFKHIVQFPWGIELGVFSSEGPKKLLPWSSGNFVLICTRALEVSYGADVLVEAFRLAYLSNGRLRLLLLGSESYESQIRKFAEDNRLSDKILIVGNATRNEMPEYFRAADAYLSCTPQDGSSISLLEALATGLPAIVADNPSNREWLSESVNGWFGKIKSPQSFSEKILEVASLNAAARDRALDLSVETVRSRANWDENFPLLLSAYEELVSK